MKPNSIAISLLTVLIAPFSLAANEPAAPVFAVVASKEVKQAGHTITYARVEPPADLPRRPVPAPAVLPTPAQTIEALRLERKNHVTLNVSATVYLTTPVITELKLKNEDTEYTCYSNVDFRDLSQIRQFEGADTVYLWFPWIFESIAEEAGIPAGLTLNASTPQYVVVNSATWATVDKSLIEGLDLIHQYYKENSAKLHKERLAREAENARREQELKENPPVKEPIVFHFWPVSPAK